MVELDELLGALALEPDGDDRFSGGNAEVGHGVVFGGQLLAQAIVAAVSGPRRQAGEDRSTPCSPGGGRPTSRSRSTVEPLHAGPGASRAAR